jgi:hypothetical protein
VLTTNELRDRRRLNTSATRRAILEFAYRRRRRGRPWTFAELHRVCRFVLGIRSRPNLNRHVLAFIEAEVIQRNQHRNAEMSLTEDGLAVYADWAEDTHPDLGADVPLAEARAIAEGARELLDDLVARLTQLTLDSRSSDPLTS